MVCCIETLNELNELRQAYLLREYPEGQVQTVSS